jgi:lysophospholipase L1-like esterase
MAAKSLRAILQGSPINALHQVDNAELRVKLEEMEVQAALNSATYFGDTVGDLPTGVEGDTGFVLDAGETGGVYLRGASTWAKTAELPASFLGSVSPEELADKASVEFVNERTAVIETQGAEGPLFSVGDGERVAFGVANDEYFSPLGPYWKREATRMAYREQPSGPLYSIGDAYFSVFAVTDSPDFRIVNPFIDRVAVSAFAATSRPKVYVAGDSRGDQVSDAGRTAARGWLWWLQLLTDSRFDFQPSDNIAIAGDDTSDMLAAVGPLLTAEPGIVIAICSTNDRTPGWQVRQSQENLATWQRLVLARGHQIIWIAETPRGAAENATYALSSADLLRHLQMRQWFLSQGSVPGVYVADPWPLVADVNSVDGYIADGLTYDGLHPGPAGGRLIAEAIAPIINQLLPERPVLISSAADLYGLNNLTGALNNNPMMTGTGGTKNTGATGSLADGWSATCGGGLSVVLSKQTDGVFAAQRAVVSGTPTAASLGASPVDPTPHSVVLSTVLDPAEFADGDVIEVAGKMTLAAGAAGLRGVSLYLAVTTSAGTVTHCSGEANLALSFPNLTLPDAAISGAITVPQFTVSGNVTAATLSVMIVGEPYSASIPPEALSCTLDVSRITARKVI